MGDVGCEAEAFANSRAREGRAMDHQRFDNVIRRVSRRRAAFTPAARCSEGRYPISLLEKACETTAGVDSAHSRWMSHS
jgi:hypothetical protein